jgi:hypothetical protein
MPYAPEKRSAGFELIKCQRCGDKQQNRQNYDNRLPFLHIRLFPWESTVAGRQSRLKKFTDDCHLERVLLLDLSCMKPKKS